MPRPYMTTISYRVRQSVARVLHQQGVGVQLRLGNRHQDEMRRPRRLVVPGIDVVTVPDQILPPLGLGGELEQALLQDLRAVDRRARLRRIEDPGADLVYQG